MMYQTRLYIGLNDAVTKTQLVPTIRARYMIIDSLTSYGIRGATIYPATGIWQYEDGSVSEENTWIVEVMLEEVFDFTPIIRDLKDALNQESIGIYTTEVPVEFV